MLSLPEKIEDTVSFILLPRFEAALPHVEGCVRWNPPCDNPTIPPFAIPIFTCPASCSSAVGIDGRDAIPVFVSSGVVTTGEG